MLHNKLSNNRIHRKYYIIIIISQEYDSEKHYVTGKNNIVASTLTRNEPENKNKGKF